MKKIISIALTLAMLFSMTAVYAAGDTPLEEEIKAMTGVNINDIKNVSVASDIEVSADGGTTYGNGPLPMNLTTAQASDFGFKATINMSGVKELVNLYDDFAQAAVAANSSLTDEYNSCYVTGEFTIDIDYPSTGITINPAAFTDTNLTGFTSAATGTAMSAVFKEVSRAEPTSPYTGCKRLTIKIKVREDVKVGLATLKANLSDLTLAYSGNSINQTGTYTIRGSVTGHTTIHSSKGTMGTTTYSFNQKAGGENSASYRDPADDISATIVVYSDSTGGTSLGGGSVQRTLTIMDGDEELSKKQYTNGSTIYTGRLEMPKKDGCVFAGYFYDKDLTEPVGESFKMTEDKVIYIKWNETALNEETHFAYIIGYPTENGREEVRPENNMTREEIATVFYRLLKDDVRDELFASTNPFDDVDNDRWSNKAISTMANGGYVNGYEDGTFKPANPITRAEFVTIATRMFAVDEVYAKIVDFRDVSGHWAEKYINYATASGWIDGYDDNTFKPDKYITRAEVMKIVNHMLDRAVNEEGLVEDAKRWIDNPSDAWYYYEVIEATNFHTYGRAEGEKLEVWEAILENEVLTEKSEYEDA